MSITYTRLPIAALALISVTACSSTAETTPVERPADWTECTDPRPQVCTFHYLPVCGFDADGNQATFGNDCSACADPKIIGHVPGACPDEKATR